MSTPVSKQVGWVTTGQVVVMAYEVRFGKSLRCEGCGRRLEPGERFTRCGMSGAGARRMPFCRECEPFEEET